MMLTLKSAMDVLFPDSVSWQLYHRSSGEDGLTEKPFSMHITNRH